MNAGMKLLVGLGVWWFAANSTDAVPGPVEVLDQVVTSQSIELAASPNLTASGSGGGSSGRCRSRGGRLSLDQVTEAAASTGLRGEALATAVAIAGWDGSPHPGESGGRTDVEGDQSLAGGGWGNSIGLWQIRSRSEDTRSGRARDATRLDDACFNAAAMHQISGGGTNWQPWTIWRLGHHQSNLPAAREAANTWN